MKRLILVAALTVFVSSLSTVREANAQRLRFGCPLGTCPTAVRVYQPYAYHAAVKACAPVGACDEVKIDAPAPCDPVREVVEPCAPVEYIPECAEDAIAVETTTIEGCVGGTCPIRTAAKVAAATTVQTVKNVAAATRFLLAVNRVRAQYNLPALKADERLDAGCETQASYCARQGQLVHGAGVAEILAQNNSGFDAAIIQWLNSPAHRALMLSGSYQYAGVSVVRDRYGRAWCAMRFR